MPSPCSWTSEGSLAEFKAKWEEIEGIASGKYDAGERPPIITTREG